MMLWPELPPRIYESLRTLCCLAAATRPLQAHEIAHMTHLPPAQTAKILQQMTWAGFARSRRGTKGGFWLRRPAGRIRVTDVADFLCHPVELPRNDPVYQALAGVATRCKKEFSRITIADLSSLSSCKTPPAGDKGYKSHSRTSSPRTGVHGLARRRSL